VTSGRGSYGSAPAVDPMTAPVGLATHPRPSEANPEERQ
jgi:hypothetical protein